MWISFYCKSLRTLWLTGSQILAPVPVVQSGSKFHFAPDQHLVRDKGGLLVEHLTSLSCLPPLHWENPSLSQWGWESVWTSGSFVPRSQGPVCQFTRRTQCYPHRPNCLHISVAFPDNIWIRKLLLNNLHTSQPTVFPINLMNYM